MFQIITVTQGNWNISLWANFRYANDSTVVTWEGARPRYSLQWLHGWRVAITTVKITYCININSTPIAVKIGILWPNHSKYALDAFATQFQHNNHDLFTDKLHWKTIQVRVSITQQAEQGSPSITTTTYFEFLNGLYTHIIINYNSITLQWTLIITVSR